MEAEVAIKVENTSDGDKLRDTKTGNLVGSVGKGKEALPSVNPVNRIDGNRVDDISLNHYEEMHSKLNLKKNPASIANMKELVEYIIADMDWLEAGADLANDKSWIWGSAEKIVSKIEFWANEENQGIYQGYEHVSSPDPAYRYEDSEFANQSPDLVDALRKLGYEHYLAQPLPVFVFGTLRPGQGNFRLLKEHGAISDIKLGKVNGVAMVASVDSGFPRALEVEKLQGYDASLYSMAGDLVYLNPSVSSLATRNQVDRLEGFRSDNPSTSLYNRVKRNIEVTKIAPETGDATIETVSAWIYVTPNPSRLDPRDIKLAGDWLNINKYSKPERRASDLNPENWVAVEEDQWKIDLRTQIEKEIEEYGEPLSNFK